VTVGQITMTVAWQTLDGRTDGRTDDNTQCGVQLERAANKTDRVMWCSFDDK